MKILKLFKTEQDAIKYIADEKHRYKTSKHYLSELTEQEKQIELFNGYNFKVISEYSAF